MKERSALFQRIYSILGFLSLALAVAAFAPAATLAQEAPSDTNQKAGGQESSDTGIESLPLSPVEKAEKNGTALPLSEKDVIRLALQNNIDIAIEDLNERTAQQNIISANASYDPTLSSTFSISSQRSANTTSYDQARTGNFSTRKQEQWSADFSQPVKTGGTFSASYSGNRTASDSTGASYNPQYSSQGTVQFRQPLMKNFRIDQNRGQLKITRLNLEISNSQFKRTVTQSVSRITQQYWDLISAIRNYDIQRNSLKLAQKNLSDIKKKVEVGTLAQIEITQANYQVAQTKLSLINAENTIERQMNSLRQSISNDKNNEIWSKVIVPTDTPDFRDFRIDRETAIDTALKNRPEMEQYSLRLKQSDINLQLARNNKKWQVDLTSRFGNSGTAGNYVVDPTSPLYRPPPEDQIGGFGQAFKNMFSSGLYNWSISVNLNIPIRNRNAEASYANQLISRKQTELNIKKQEQSIQVEILNAIQAIESNRQQVDTAKLNKALAQEQLDGENKRFEAGLSEFYRVLDQQNRYYEAENRELTALIQYKQSIITLQEAMNTLLESKDIEMAKGASERFPDFK